MKLFFILFLFISCSKQVTVNKQNGIFYISDIDLSIGNARAIKWEVGLKREKIVSQGILLSLDVAHMKSSDQEKLISAYGIDSWIYRIIRKKNNRKEIIGHIELPFNKISSTTDDFTIQILYAAAIPSDKFRRFYCPAFNHRKLITDLKTLETPHDPFTLYMSPNETIKSQTQTLEYINISFSGGTSLQGEYFTEIALYNRGNKKVYGKFHLLNGSVKIDKEKEVQIQSCVGIKEEVRPLPSSRKTRLQDFEIK